MKQTQKIYILIQKTPRAATHDFSILGVAEKENTLKVIIENAVQEAQKAYPNDEGFIEYYKKSFSIIQAPFFK